jgi:hypothetical protein
MKIIFTPSTGSKATLAAGGKRAPQNLRVNGQRVLQIATFPRASSAEVLPRKNHQTTVTFSVTEEYADLDAAGAAVFEAQLLSKERGTLLIICQGQQGNVSNRYIGKAVIQAIDATQRGIAVDKSYTIVGGDVSTSEPT